MEQVQPSIESMNETIGIFMGGKWETKTIVGRSQRRFYYNDIPFAFVKNPTDLNYHKDWDELIPVIASIPKLIHAEEDLKKRRQMSARYKPIENELCNFNIIHTHYCVYKFIQFYNQQKQSI